MDGKDTNSLSRKHSQNYTREQMAAIRRSINVGRILNSDYAQIAKMYREGNTQPEICEQLDIASSFSINDETARVAVGLAIRGYDGNFGGSTYNALISDKEELSDLAARNVSRNGKTLVKEKRGAFSIPSDERKKIARASGKKSLDEKLGIHGMSDEERKVAGDKGRETVVRDKLGYLGLTASQRKEACHLATIANGRTPWIERENTDTFASFSELEFAGKLSQSKEYLYESGGNKGKPINGKIARKLNELYHEGRNVRSSIAVAQALFRLKQK